MKRLLLACTLLMSSSMIGNAQNTVGPVDTRNFGSVPYIANGSNTPRTPAVRAAERINVRDLGAVGDNTTDDSPAFANAITRANALMTAGTPAVVYVPTGKYLIAGTQMPRFAQNMGGGIVGEGSWKSIIRIDPAYVGDLFSWSDAWLAGTINGGSTALTLPTKLGPRAEGLTILGDQTAAGQQNAFVLYDHNDFAYFNDIDVNYLHGRAFYAGARLNDTASYIRESRFRNLRIFNSGMPGVPVFELTSDCTVSCAAGDATNEIDISGLDIYGSRGPSLVIRNASPITISPIRAINISRLRVEGTESNTYGVTADLVTIGDAAMTGLVNSVSFSESELLSPYTNYAAFRTTGPSLAARPQNISFAGLITAGGGGGYGIKVDAGSSLAFRLQYMGSVQTNLTVASSSTTAAPILIDGYGTESAWTYAIDTTALQYVKTPGNRFGNLTPQSTTTFQSAQIPDSSVNSGNPRGVNSVDHQTVRFGATQVASGVQSIIAGGTNNTAGFNGSVVSGGNQNVSASFMTVVGGGANNVASGSFATIPGGWFGNTLGNYGMMAYASGQFAASGDAQLGFHVLRAATSSVTATRLTSDGLAASAGTLNTLVPANNSVWSIDLDCVYRDTVSAAVATWYWKNILMVRGANAAATVVTAPSATVGATSGTPGATTPAIAADTTIGALALTFTAPNADLSHTVCRAKTVIVQ